jgi:NADH dehydrogenase FAD-containing subunit
VLALGSISNYLGMRQLQENSFDFKSLADSMHIRNHVIEMFEYADRDPDPATRQVLLTFVVAGGGFAGAELVVPFSGGKTVRFSGLFAWLLWRGIYLGKLPGLERKVRVLSDWIIELFFPRDIVQTIDVRPITDHRPPTADHRPVQAAPYM